MATPWRQFMLLALVSLVVVAAAAVWLALPHEPRPTPAEVVPTWVRLDRAFADPGTLLGFDLAAGALGRPDDLAHVSKRFEVPLGPAADLTRALPVVSQPSNGRVAFAFFDGAKSELHLLDIASATDTLVASEVAVIHAVAVDTLGTAYVVVLDPVSREELGIYEVRDGGPWKRVIEPRDLPWRALRDSRLFLPPNGGTLLSVDCTYSDCTARLYSLKTGVLIGARSLSGDVVAVDEHAIGTQTFCSIPCAQEVIGIPNLEPAQVGRSCGPMMFTRRDGQPALVSGSAGDCSAEGDELVAKWPDGGQASVGVPALSGFILFQPTQFGVVELPSGWVLLTDDGSLNGPADAALFDVVTGKIVEAQIRQ